MTLAQFLQHLQDDNLSDVKNTCNILSEYDLNIKYISLSYIIEIIPPSVASAFLEMDHYWNTSCHDCWDLDPPPDMILIIPPPPMPEFLANSLLMFGNRTTPCPLLCDWTTGQEVDMIEIFPQIGKIEDHDWFILSHSIFIILLGLLLAALVTILLLKYRMKHKLKKCLLGNTYYKHTRSYESISHSSMKDTNMLWAKLNRKGKPRTVSCKAIPSPSLSQDSRNTNQYLKTHFSKLNSSSWQLSSPLRIFSLNSYSISQKQEFPSLL